MSVAMNVKDVRIQNQRDVIDVIQRGSLNDFISRNIGTVIDEPLLPSEVIEYHPKYHPNEEYIRAIDMTPLMFAIICERDDIVEYILKHLNPDLDHRHHFSNYTPFVLSTLTDDCRCMNLFLTIKSDWVNEHIADNLSFFNSSNRSHKTTVFHLLTNRRDYPKLAKLINFVGERVEKYDIASISGSTPKSIASYNNDETALQILDVSNERHESSINNYLNIFEDSIKSERIEEQPNVSEEIIDNDQSEAYERLREFAPNALKQLQSLQGQTTENKIDSLINTLHSILSLYAPTEDSTIEQVKEEETPEIVSKEITDNERKCSLCHKLAMLHKCSYCGSLLCETCMTKHVSKLHTNN